MNLKFYLRGLGIGIVVTAVIMLILSGINNNSSTLTDEQIKEKAAELGMVEENTTLLSLAETQEPSPTPQEVISPVLATPEETLTPTGEAMQTPEEVLTLPEDNEPSPTPIFKTSEAVPTANTEVLEQAEEVLEQAEDTLAQIKNGDESGNDENKPKATPTPKATATPKTTATPTPKATPTPEATPSPEAENTDSAETVKLTVNRGDSSYTVAKKLQALGLVENAASFDTYLCNTGKDRRIRSGEFNIPKGSSEEEIAKKIAG